MDLTELYSPSYGTCYEITTYLANGRIPPRLVWKDLRLALSSLRNQTGSRKGAPDDQSRIARGGRLGPIFEAVYAPALRRLRLRADPADHPLLPHRQ